MEKSIILNGIERKNNGVLTVNTAENCIKLNLNVAKKSYILVVKTDKIRAYYIEDIDDTIPCKVDNLSEIVGIVVENNNLVLYGSSGDKMKAFSLFSEYKRLLKNGKIDVKKCNKDIKNSNKTAEKDAKNSKKTAENGNKTDINSTINNDTNLQDCNYNNQNIAEKNSVCCDKNCCKKSENFVGNSDILRENIVKNSVKTCKKQDKNEEKSQGEEDKNGEYLYKGDNFFMSIHNQIDELFVCYPEDKTVSKHIDNSRFVKIEYSKGEFYIVGVVYSGKDAKYLCYGIQGVRHILPPKEVAQYAKFLTVKEQDASGFWMIFQDAKTGITVKKEQISII